MGSRTWNASRKDFKKYASFFDKRLNPAKMRELDNMLKETGKVFNANELVKKLCRKTIEEVQNIIDYNEKWNDISVKSDSNSTKTRCKIRIQYDGGKYYDPEENSIDNVLGYSIEKYVGGYEREWDKDKISGDITIKINIGLKKELGDDDV